MKINGKEVEFNSLSLKNLKKIQDANRIFLSLEKEQEKLKENGEVYEFAISQVKAFKQYFEILGIGEVIPEEVDEPIILGLIYQDFLNGCTKQKEEYAKKYLGK